MNNGRHDWGGSQRVILAMLQVFGTDRRLRSKRDLWAQAVEGRVKPHHRLVLTELSCQIDSVDETMARFDARIQEICGPFDEAVELLDTIPGLARRTAEMIIADIGADMTRFPSTDHLASWAVVAPGDHESAGKRMPGKTRNRILTCRQSTQF
jgi:transposase